MKHTVDVIQSIAIICLGLAGIIANLRGNNNGKK